VELQAIERRVFRVAVASKQCRRRMTLTAVGFVGSYGPQRDCDFRQDLRVLLLIDWQAFAKLFIKEGNLRFRALQRIDDCELPYT
jgi:hypothetical protein